MKKFFKDHKFIIFLFSSSFIIRLIYILMVDTPIISDFKAMYDASIEIINGTNNYKDLPYFVYWGYQMGHVIYQALLLSICNSVTFLEIVNCITTSLTVVFIYLICNIHSSNKSSKIVSIIYSFFPFPLFMNSVLSNQQASLLLILIATYLLLKINYNKYISKSIIIGLLLGISNILRSEAIVIIFSIFIYTLLSLRKTLWKKPLISFGLILLIYLSIFNCTSLTLKITNISQNGLENKNPAWKFVTGLNFDTNGSYSEEDAATYSTNYDLAKQEVINRIKDYKKLPNLFLKKIKKLWTKSDLYWPLGHISNKSLYNYLTVLNQYFIYFFIILSLMSLTNIFHFNRTCTLFLIILLTYFIVYLFIEVMPRYAYNLQVFEVILSSFTLDKILKNRKD